MIGHVIHIGLPKTGATYLQKWFAAHPQIAYRDGGFAGFQSPHAIAAAAAIAPDRRVRCRVTSAEVLSAPRPDAGGESAQVDYDRTGRASIAAEQARTCEMLAEIFPSARILIVTRGFRAAILSGYSQFVRTGGCEDIAAMLGPGPRDYPWSYDRLIEMYRRAFGADNVLVLPFELLRDDPERFLRTLETRIGLDPFPFASPAANVSVSPAELAWYPAMNRAAGRLARTNGRLGRWYGRMLFRRRLAPVARLLQRLSPKPPVTAQLIGDDFLEQFRGQAETLRDEPLYRPYLADYLL